MDATIIDAPSSTKNEEKARDPEMHQIRKGNEWRFGMKCHVGVDAGSGLVHTVTVTSANKHDITEHWLKIRTNNVIERLNREIRHRTRVVGTFPDGNSALMLVCARLRHVAGTQWGGKKYMSMKHLEVQEDEAS